MNKQVAKWLRFSAKCLGGALVLAVAILPVFTTIRSITHDTKPPESTKLHATIEQPIMQVRKIDRDKAIRPFDAPLLTISFDDGWKSIYTDALPLLQQYGLPTTQYIITSQFSALNYMSLDQVKSLQAAGHEIASHTVTHQDMNTLSDSQLEVELGDSYSELFRLFGKTAQDLAAPYGTANDHVKEQISNYYRSNRSSDAQATFMESRDINTRVNFDIYGIKAFAVTRDTTITELRQLVDYAVAHNGWLIVVYHQVNDDPADKYGVSKAQLQEQLQYLSSTSLRSATMGKALDAIQAQNKVEF